MSIVPFLVVCGVGAFLGMLAAPFPRLARLLGVGALALAFLAALTIKPTDQLTVGHVQLTTSWYAGLFLSSAVACCLIVCILGLAVGWPERLAPAALATFGGLAVAFTATDPSVVFAAIAASAVPAILVAIGAHSEARVLDVSLAELRTLGLIAAGALIAAALVLQPGWTTSDPTFVFALAYLALGLAVAVRFGAVPFHVPAARLSKSNVKLGLALSLVWIPAGLGIVALSWSTSVFQRQGEWLDVAVAGLQVIAVATLILGALGALLHEELEEIATYSIVQDAAFVLLALAARDADAAEPTRLWLLAFIVAKSALVAWVVTLSSTHGSSKLQDLRGWFRRSPILGVALIGIVVATLGWPGSPVSEARTTLIRLALPSQLQFLGIVAVFGAIAYYGRLIGVGLMAPGELVKSSTGERPRWPHSQLAVAAKSPRTRAARAALRAPAVKAPPAEKAAPDDAPPAPGRSISGAGGRLRSGAVRSIRAAIALARQLPAAWRLNRRLETSLLVLGISALAIAIAFGGFGASKASSTGISLDAVVAPTPLLPVLGPTTPPLATPAPSTVTATPSGGQVGPVVSATPGPGGSGVGSSPSSGAQPSQLTGD
jgi:NADH:ubiquinone oxidoreductase subunit 2 (subunit N)